MYWVTNFCPHLPFRLWFSVSFCVDFLRTQSNEIFEVLVPANHEHWHKFYLCQPLFKSVDIYVKMFSFKRALYVYFHMWKNKICINSLTDVICEFLLFPTKITPYNVFILWIALTCSHYALIICALVNHNICMEGFLHYLGFVPVFIAHSMMNSENDPFDAVP
jgi:hypothetical protein